jgi:hypothetical protein
VDEFLDYVLDGAATVTSPIASRNAVAVGVAATESLRSGSIPIRVAPVAPAVAARLEPTGQLRHRPGSNNPG